MDFSLPFSVCEGQERGLVMNRSQRTSRRKNDAIHALSAIVGSAQTLHRLGKHELACELLKIVAMSTCNGFKSGESYKRRLKAARNVIANLEGRS